MRLHRRPSTNTAAIYTVYTTTATTTLIKTTQPPHDINTTQQHQPLHSRIPLPSSTRVATPSQQTLRRDKVNIRLPAQPRAGVRV
jgi:hypothetical protein